MLMKISQASLSTEEQSEYSVTFINSNTEDSPTLKTFASG